MNISALEKDWNKTDPSSTDDLVAQIRHFNHYVISRLYKPEKLRWRKAGFVKRARTECKQSPQ